MLCESRDTQPRACGGLESWMAVFDMEKKGGIQNQKNPLLTSRWPTSQWRYVETRAPRLAASLHPSTMEAWLSASEKTWQSGPSHRAGMIPRFAA